MKLYATTTSERASKGQGGNKQVVTTYTCQNELTKLNDEVMRVEMTQHTGGSVSIRVFSLVSEQDMLVKLPDRYTKGEKKKGDGINICEHDQTTKTVHGEYCLNCHAYL